MGQMSEIFLFVGLTSGWNLIYLHLLIRLISSKKYWSVVENSVTVLKGLIQVKFYL